MAASALLHTLCVKIKPLDMDGKQQEEKKWDWDCVI